MTKDTFVAQVEAHKGMMYRVALTILQNDADVQDALQETALRAWAKRHTMRDESYFGTWMTRILINECYAVKRRQKRVVLMDEWPQTAAAAEGITLRLIMDALPDKHRLPLVLKYTEGMDDAEIAAVLHLTIPAVRSRIRRARKALRKELDENA